jgi:hypothetical protein
VDRHQCERTTLLQRHAGAADGDLWAGLKGKHASRWASVYRPRWPCWTFALRLPQQVQKGSRLLRACLDRLAETPRVGGIDERVLTTLVGKLRAAKLHHLCLAAIPPPHRRE